jgi:5'-deoxynucleotidase YfbR-like HD superfamily hydrolase
MNIFQPTQHMICIEDIAHSLSHQCRFNGHLPTFYSVAHHSILTAERVDPEHKLAALLHDASEAYLCDIPRPIKPHLTNYKEIEDKLMQVIAEKFGFGYPLHSDVKQADEYMLIWEWHDLMLQDYLYPAIKPTSPLDRSMISWTSLHT